MRAEDRVLFAAARQDFQAIEGLPPVDWEEVATIAESHGVAPIVAANLKLESLQRALFENVLIQAQEAERVAQGIGRLREAGYEVMLLKGLALELLVYREPWVTTSKDADLLLRPGRRLSADEREVRRSLYRSGIECDVSRHHDLDMNGVLPVRYDRIWAAARRVEYHGQEAFVMANEDLLISLCVNSCRKRFFRLKHLFDIAESTRRLDLDWDRLAARAREDRCEAIVSTALHVTAETLGCPVPELKVPRLQRLLIARWLRRGTLASQPPAWLPYASYRPEQALRSLRIALTWKPPEHRRAAVPVPGR